MSIIDLDKPLNEQEGSVLLPEGKYAYEIIKVTEEAGGAGPMLKIHYKVISDGIFNGQKPFPDNISLAEASRWKLVAFLRAIGAPGKAKSFDPAKFVGRRLIAATRQETYNENPRNKYAGYELYDAETAKDLAKSVVTTTEKPVGSESVGDDWD